MTQTVTLNKPDELGTITVTWPVFLEMMDYGIAIGTEVEAKFERGEKAVSQRWVVHNCQLLGNLLFAWRVARAIRLARRFLRRLDSERGQIGRDTSKALEGEYEPEPEPEPEPYLGPG